MSDKKQTISTDKARGGETHDRTWLFVGLAAGLAVVIVVFAFSA